MALAFLLELVLLVHKEGETCVDWLVFSFSARYLLWLRPFSRGCSYMQTEGIIANPNIKMAQNFNESYTQGLHVECGKHWALLNDQMNQ